MRPRPSSRIVLLVALLAITVLVQAALPGQTLQRLGLATNAATTVSLIPSSESLAIGGETWITIRVSDVVNLYGADIRMSYNPAVIEIVEYVPGMYSLEFGTFPYPRPGSVQRPQQRRRHHMVCRDPDEPARAGYRAAARSLASTCGA